jgi:hypothetical protein
MTRNDDTQLGPPDAVETGFAFSGESKSIRETLYWGQSVDQAVLRQAEADTQAEWQVGDVTLDLYEVKDVLEEGGFGVVYRVHQRQWNVERAIRKRIVLNAEQSALRPAVNDGFFWWSRKGGRTPDLLN